MIHYWCRNSSGPDVKPKITLSGVSGSMHFCKIFQLALVDHFRKNIVLGVIQGKLKSHSDAAHPYMQSGTIYRGVIFAAM